MHMYNVSKSKDAFSDGHTIALSTKSNQLNARVVIGLLHSARVTAPKFHHVSLFRKIIASSKG